MGFEAEAVDDSTPELPYTSESFDVVIARELLERVEWDRWALQEIHRVLHDRGILILIAANMFGMSSLRDVSYLATLVAKHGRNLVTRKLRHRVTPRPFEYRKYRLPRLLEMLESIAFLVREVQTVDPGMFAPVLAAKPALAPQLGTTHVIVAERRPVLFAAQGLRTYPSASEHEVAFRRTHASMLEIRDRWIAAHRGGSAAAARVLEPAFYRGRNVLVLAPHPDDEIIGCGGTLHRLIQAGAKVTAIHATDGSDSAALSFRPDNERQTVRLREAESVGRRIGFEKMEFWREDNRAFGYRPELVERLVTSIESLQPALIFTPFVTDFHPDHQTLNRILSDALRSARILLDGSVLSYEVWSLTPGNVYCDVTEVMSEVAALLLLYTTAMRVDDFVHFCESRNYDHALKYAGRPGYAEVFFETSPGDFPTLLQTVGASQ
jgi:LmbE family N-acetylglucosaminyl deacetylase